MKKIITIFSMVAVLLMATDMQVNAATKAERALKKEVKTRVKSLQKDGWEVIGMRPMDASVAEHIKKLQSPGTNELVSIVENVSSPNVAMQQAHNNAMVRYASNAKSHVIGRVSSEVGNIAGQEIDNFYAAYERMVSAEIRGELKESVILKRKARGGQSDYRVYYLINEDDASKARLRAMQNALNESKLAQSIAEQISDFVREGFTIYE